MAAASVDIGERIIPLSFDRTVTVEKIGAKTWWGETTNEGSDSNFMLCYREEVPMLAANLVIQRGNGRIYCNMIAALERKK